MFLVLPSRQNGPGVHVIDLSFHSHWEYRGQTRSTDRLFEYWGIFGNKRMIYVVEPDGVIKFYTERPGFAEVSATPTGYREVYCS